MDSGSLGKEFLAGPYEEWNRHWTKSQGKSSPYAARWRDHWRLKAHHLWSIYMVQYLFPNAPTTPQDAIRVAYFLLVTSKCVSVTAEAAGFLVRIPNSEKRAEPREDRER